MSTHVNAPLLVGSGVPAVLGDISAQWGDARESRMVRDRHTPPTGADADYRWLGESRYYRVVEQARSMQDEDAVIGPALKMSRRKTVGPNGFSFDPQTESKRYNQQWWERFNEYSQDKSQCDVKGHRTFAQMCGLLYSQALTCGDILAVGVEDANQIKIQAWEADQIRTPSTKRNNDVAATTRTVLGVEMNRIGERLSYYVATRFGLTGTARDQDIKPIQVKHPGLGLDQAWHIYNAYRFSQTRGVTALYSAFPTADYFEDINFAKLVQSLVCSCIGFVEEVPRTAEEEIVPRNAAAGHRRSRRDVSRHEAADHGGDLPRRPVQDEAGPQAPAVQPECSQSGILPARQADAAAHRCGDRFAARHDADGCFGNKLQRLAWCGRGGQGRLH
jgi:capsid protein